MGFGCALALAFVLVLVRVREIAVARRGMSVVMAAMLRRRQGNKIDRIGPDRVKSSRPRGERKVGGLYEVQGRR
ncbi:hypothetical protein CI102_3721 [Trichoderma harzianum]|nr:hypothetical protein CI102_3721 [Trichoderma harzianum]